MTETRDRIRNPSINFPQSSEEAMQAIIHKTRQLLLDPGRDFNLTHVYSTDSGLGTVRTQQQADWLNTNQSVLAAVLEDVLDRIDESAKEPTS